MELTIDQQVDAAAKIAERQANDQQAKALTEGIGVVMLDLLGAYNLGRKSAAGDIRRELPSILRGDA